MTNREKYAEEIKNFDGNFCSEFINPIIFKSNKCPSVDCYQCRMLQMLWLEEEFVEPEPQVDWSKVPVDTKILVRDNDKEDWSKAYFAEYEDNTVHGWEEGGTSWSTCFITPWKYAKLAEDGE